MKCRKCGAEIPAQSKFCLSCGEAVSSGTAEAPSPAVVPKKRLGLWGAIAGLCVVALLVFLALKLQGSRVTQATPPPNLQQTPVLRAPASPDSPQASVLQTDVQKPPLDLKKPEQQPPPEEVVRYLEHLKRVEQARMALQEKEITALGTLLAQAWAAPFKRMLELTDPDVADVGDDTASQAEMKKTFATLTREWQQLSAYFLSVPAPTQCQVLAGKYYDALREVIIHFGKVQSCMINQDMNVMNMRGKSRSIDEKLVAADGELANVCRVHNVDKTFSIQADVSQTPLLGF